MDVDGIWIRRQELVEVILQLFDFLSDYQLRPSMTGDMGGSTSKKRYEIHLQGLGEEMGHNKNARDPQWSTWGLGIKM